MLVKLPNPKRRYAKFDQFIMSLNRSFIWGGLGFGYKIIERIPNDYFNFNH